MIYIYCGVALFCLSVSLYFHFKLKSQEQLLNNEAYSQAEGLITGGSSVRHGMVVQEDGSLVPDSKLTANYYTRLKAITS